SPHGWVYGVSLTPLRDSCSRKVLQTKPGLFTMTKKNIFFLLAVLLLVLTELAFANSEENAMQTVVQQLNSVTVIHGKFEQQKPLQGLDSPLTSSGPFIFWKEKGLYLTSDTPFFNASTITPDNIIHWQENGTGSISEEQSGLIQREISRTLLAF